MNAKDRMVYKTDNYDRFKELFGNRDLTEIRVKKIMQSIAKIGYVCSPIIVNEKNEVIDGQGRLEAVKRLGLPVYYIIEPGIGVKECQTMNIDQGNWKLQDFVSSYSKLGDMNYRYLDQLTAEYTQKGFSANSLNAMAFGTVYYGGGNSLGRTIKSGGLKFTQRMYDQARKTCEWMIPVLPIFKKLNSRDVYVSAMRFVWDQVDCDKVLLIEKIQNYQAQLIPVKTMDQALTALEEVYNFRNRKKVYMAVAYKMWCDEKKDGKEKKTA